MIIVALVVVKIDYGGREDIRDSYRPGISGSFASVDVRKALQSTLYKRLYCKEIDQTDVCNNSFMPRRVKDSSFAV